jgi:hypothetical protein
MRRLTDSVIYSHIAFNIKINNQPLSIAVLETHALLCTSQQQAGTSAAWFSYLMLEHPNDQEYESLAWVKPQLGIHQIFWLSATCTYHSNIKVLAKR